MGRPLNKRYFGPSAGGDGFQLIGRSWFTGSITPEECYIVKQKSNYKYIVRDSATGTKEEIASLVDADPTAIGELQIRVSPDGGTTFKNAKNISGRRVKTFDGFAYVWSDLSTTADSTPTPDDADIGEDPDLEP